MKIIKILFVFFFLIIFSGCDQKLPNTGCISGNCKNGQGSYTYPNGDEYIGQWKDGKFHGQGTLINYWGRKGEFKGGTAHGQATLVNHWAKKYIGEFKDGKKHGQGTLTFFDGREFIGEFKDDKMPGQWTVTYPDGSKYVGQLKDLKMHGYGTLTKPDGREYRGLFTHGLPVGELSLKNKVEGEIAQANNDLDKARQLQKQGKYSQAEELVRNVLRVFEKELGVDHLKTATCLNTLGIIYEKQGKFQEAERAHKRALAIREKLFKLAAIRG